MSHVPPQATTERIWRELSDRLRRFIRSRVPSEADADEILQTVFLRIHQRLHALRQVERLEAWVFQITRNAITDHFRKRRDVSNDDAPEVAVAEPPVDENVNGEVAVCVRMLIDQLPDDQRRAVSLYELEGVSQADVAQRESISLSGAKSRIQRGRQKLETLLHQCCQFYLDARGNVLDYKAVGDECDSGCGCVEGDA